MSIPANAKYAIIREMTLRDNNRLNISWLCETACVSRSGYYSYIENEAKRQEREEVDRKDFLLIVEAYKFRGYDKGARGIKMRLLHLDPPVNMNLKKIRRLMHKYGLKCPVRRANPYRRMAQALRTNTVFPNVVDRDFSSAGPRKVLLTDITYIFYKTGVCYLSTILDACTHEILAYELSSSLDVSFVLRTVTDLTQRYGSELDDTTIIHSDQGCHYTSKAFIKKLSDARFVQSMSRKGNCWDNAPQESFFGHMKDEIMYEVRRMETVKQVRRKVDDWIGYYNDDRYQWELNRLSPREYHSYLTTGRDPLAEV